MMNKTKFNLKNVIAVAIVLESISLLSSCKKEDQVVTNIALDKSELTLIIESKYQLKVSHTPENLEAPRYNWSTSDENVVTVDWYGGVYAKGLGTAIITVTSSENESLISECKIIVEEILPSKIKLDVNELELFVDEEYTLSYIIEPDDITNKQITWSSSENNIVVVDEFGKVKALSVGEAEIIVKTNNQLSDICNIKVNPVRAQAISFDQTELNIEISDIEKLIVDFIPANTTNKKINWSSSDTSIAEVSEDGEVVGIGEGNVIITGIVEDNGQEISCNVEVKLKGLSLSETVINILPNEHKNLQVFYSTSNKPYTQATWVSSNPEIVTITIDEDNNAIIETKNIGFAIISAISEDGSKSATCDVYVKEIEDFINLSFIANSAVSINGFITADFYSVIKNNSTQPIELISFYMYDSYSFSVVAYTTNEAQLGELLPGKSINLGKKINSVYYPYCEWTFIWNGEIHRVSHLYSRASPF